MSRYVKATKSHIIKSPVLYAAVAPVPSVDAIHILDPSAGAAGKLPVDAFHGPAKKAAPATDAAALCAISALVAAKISDCLALYSDKAACEADADAAPAAATADATSLSNVALGYDVNCPLTSIKTKLLLLATVITLPPVFPTGNRSALLLASSSNAFKSVAIASKAALTGSALIVSPGINRFVC